MRHGLGHQGLSLTALLAFDANVHAFRDFISFCNSGGLVIFTAENVCAWILWTTDTGQ